MRTYSDYSRDRIGWFFGISGWQLAALAVASLPIFWAINSSDWIAVVLMAALWQLALVVVVVPIRGRSAAGWTLALLAHSAARLLGWTRFSAHATRGRTETLTAPDLPGILQGIEIHDGPPHGPTMERVAVVQDHAHRTWAVTAAIVHPGIGMDDSDRRRQYGGGLAQLLDVAARSEKVAEILFVSRTVPEDGAERELWVRDHLRSTGPDLARRIDAELSAGLSSASVRTEHFVTVVVPESRIAKSAREAGGGLDGRCRELQLLMSELEAHLRGAMGMTSVSWLDSPSLALACRTGFAPGDRAGVVQALAERHHDAALSMKPVMNADVPWAMAGPSGADAAARHYSHDAWNSISVTVSLPAGGVAMGALAPALTPSEAGERRSMLVSYPILRSSEAQRRSANSEWAADTAVAMRTALGMKTRAKQREETSRARGMDSRLAQGHAMLRPYAVCTVTVPKTYRVSDFGRRLDAAVRRCGLAPLRLDLCQDAAFAASVIPLGVGLTRRGA